MVKDLGVITVPNDYSHSIQLARFRAKFGKGLSFFHEAITDEHFMNPSHVLYPGNKLHVQVFGQIPQADPTAILVPTMAEERLAFLAARRAVLTGAQGLSLAFEQKGEHFPRGSWCASFDERINLWEGGDNEYHVPSILFMSPGDVDFGLSAFDGTWDEDQFFLGFFPVE